MATRYGRRFYKMTGSGNDFVFVDARTEQAGELEDPTVIDAICARGTGVGADGIVFIDQPASDRERFAIRYYNRDGSPAFCGNASLCSVRLGVELGIVRPGEEFAFGTLAGAVHGRLTANGPEIDLEPVNDLRPEAGFTLAPGERRIGYALVGVPHLVVQCDDASVVDVVGRGRPLRLDPSLPVGANVNFVSKGPQGWAMRTYERGVERETLACGSGAVATAALLERWGEAGNSVELRTRSGLLLRVRFSEGDAGQRTPSLGGEGRIVFRGELAA